MRTFTSFCLLGAGVAVFAVDTAAGQSYFQRDRYESVQERNQPEFDPQPLRVGTLLVNPALDAGLIFDDNALSSPNDADSDLIVRLAPRIGARTDWSNHEVAANLDVEHLEYQDLSEESRTNVRGALRGRLDVNRELSLRGRVFGEDLVQDRRVVAASDVLENVEYTNLGASIGADYERSRIRLSGTFRTNELDYDDTRLRPDPQFASQDPFDQDFRDRTENELVGRASYAVSPDIAIFGQAELNQRDYAANAQDLANGDQSVDDVNGRDSEGYVLTAGANFELAALIRGDFAIGYFEDDPDGSQNTNNVSGEPISGLAIDTRVQWFPTRLTTVTVQAARRANDPGIVNAANAISTSGTLRIDHELRRNVLLFGETGLSQQEFDTESQFDDEVFNIGAGALYKLNPNVHLNGYVRHYNRSAENDGRDFDQNVVGIGLTLYP